MKTFLIYIWLLAFCSGYSQDFYTKKFGYGATSGWIKLAQFDLENGSTHNSIIIDVKINFIRTYEEGYSAIAKIFLRKGTTYQGKWNYTINGTEVGDLVKFKQISDNVYELYSKSEGNYGHVSIDMSVVKEGSFTLDIPVSTTTISDPDIYQDVPKSGDLVFLAGNLGIGTTSPDSKLTVKGNIHAEEVKVDLSVPGPDYVFKEGYDLRSLEEVQNYIKEHGHLPNIPSAREMEENGIDLGAMNMKLLEKIEELTLYVLDLKNEITDLKSRSK